MVLAPVMDMGSDGVLCVSVAAMSVVCMGLWPIPNCWGPTGIVCLGLWPVHNSGGPTGISGVAAGHAVGVFAVAVSGTGVIFVGVVFPGGIMD